MDYTEFHRNYTFWENATFRPEIHIPNLVSHSLAVFFGVPLNGYLILELSIRAMRRKLPRYAYCILGRSVIDLLIIFPRIHMDLDPRDWIPNTIQQCMELFALMLDLLTVTIWKTKSKSSTRSDHLILILVPAFTIFQTLFIMAVTLYLGDMDKEFWDFVSPIVKTSRMMIFCVVYLAYFFSVRQPDKQFLTPFVLETHHKIVRFFLINIVVLTVIILLLGGRWTAIIIVKGTLSWDNPFQDIRGTAMDLYWDVTVVYPAIRAAATIWAFPQLLHNAFGK